MRAVETRPIRRIRDERAHMAGNGGLVASGECSSRSAAGKAATAAVRIRRLAPRCEGEVESLSRFVGFCQAQTGLPLLLLLLLQDGDLMICNQTTVVELSLFCSSPTQNTWQGKHPGLLLFFCSVGSPSPLSEEKPSLSSRLPCVLLPSTPCSCFSFRLSAPAEEELFMASLSDDAKLQLLL
uniref:Uncharacterized protein n=1 Tax=Setaria italica TaxID=4555 RepID=K3YJU6_SETIT